MTPPSAAMGTSAWTAVTSERGSARFEGGARLLLSCVERPGIIAAVSQFLGGRGANILESDQHKETAGFVEGSSLDLRSCSS